MRQTTQPPARRPVPPGVVVPTMVTTVLVAAALAVATVLSEPAPIMIELAPQDFAARDGNQFTYDQARTATPGGLSHLGTTTEAEA